MKDKPIQAVLLVGGKGTRLRAVVSDRPKPLVKVGGRPFVEWVLLALAEQRFREVVLCISYMGDMIREYLGDGSKFGLKIAYSEDPEQLGTGGAVRQALPLLKSDPVLVLNGDSYCHVNLVSFVDSHGSQGTQGSIVLVRADDTGRYGRIQLGENGLIEDFGEKSGTSGPGWINAGIYLLSRNLIGSIPEGRSVSIERELFPRWVGLGLYGYTCNGSFLDIGTSESLAGAESFFAGLRNGLQMMR